MTLLRSLSNAFSLYSRAISIGSAMEEGALRPEDSAEAVRSLLLGASAPVPAAATPGRGAVSGPGNGKWRIARAAWAGESRGHA